MTQIKCLKCNDIIQSDGYGKFVQCSCGSCYIDETQYYCRVGGDPKKSEIFDENESKWVLVEDYLKEHIPKKDDKNENN